MRVSVLARTCREREERGVCTVHRMIVLYLHKKMKMSVAGDPCASFLDVAHHRIASHRIA